MESPSSIDDSVETFKAICRNCHGGCGTIVKMLNGVVTEVIGDKSNPINKGNRSRRRRGCTQRTGPAVSSGATAPIISA